MKSIELTNLFRVPYSSTSFKSGLQSLLPRPPGTHIVVPDFEENSAYKTGGKYFNEPVTFWEMLERCLCSEADPKLGGNDEAPHDCQRLQQPCSPFAASTGEQPYGSSSCLYASQSSIESPKIPSPDVDRALWDQIQIQITRLRQELAEADGQHKQRIKILTKDHQRQLSTESEQHLVYIKSRDGETQFWEAGQVCLSLGFPKERKQISIEGNIIDPLPGKTASTGSDNGTISKTRITCLESNLRIIPTHTALECPEMTDRTTASPISEAENDHRAAEINGMISSTPSKRKRLSNIFLSWKKRRLAQAMARNDNVLAENDVLISSSIHNTQHAPVASPSVSTKGRLSRIIISEDHQL